MKEINAFVYILFFVLVLFASCKKKDKDAPRFQVIGSSLATTPLRTAYIDSGVIVKDESKFSVDTISTIKLDSMGTYFYRYIAVDEEGNMGVYTRNVKVIVAHKGLLGDYEVVETVTSGPSAGGSPYNYEINITGSNPFDRILLYYFGAWGSDIAAYAIVDEDGIITIPQQAFHEGQLSGSGTINYDGRSFMVDYEYEYDKGTDVARFEATYIADK